MFLWVSFIILMFKTCIWGLAGWNLNQSHVVIADACADLSFAVVGDIPRTVSWVKARPWPALLWAMHSYRPSSSAEARSISHEARAEFLIQIPLVELIKFNNNSTTTLNQVLSQMLAQKTGNHNFQHSSLFIFKDLIQNRASKKTQT